MITKVREEGTNSLIFFLIRDGTCPIPLNLRGFELSYNQQNVAEVTLPIFKDADWLLKP